MADSKSEVVSDRPIPNLNSLKVFYYSASYAYTNIQVYISKDGATWGEPLSDGNYSMLGIDLAFPQGDYYIRLKSTGSPKVWIDAIKYTWGDCDCKAVETPVK